MHKPYTKEHLDDRREALQRGRVFPMNLGRAAVGALCSAALIGGASFVAQHFPSMGDNVNPITREMNATPPIDRPAKVVEICLRDLPTAELPVGFPDCNVVLTPQGNSLQASVKP